MKSWIQGLCQLLSKDYLPSYKRKKYNNDQFCSRIVHYLHTRHTIMCAAFLAYKESVVAQICYCPLRPKLPNCQWNSKHWLICMPKLKFQQYHRKSPTINGTQESEFRLKSSFLSVAKQSRWQPPEKETSFSALCASDRVSNLHDFWSPAINNHSYTIIGNALTVIAIPLIGSKVAIEQWLMTRHLSDTSPHISISTLSVILTFLQHYSDTFIDTILIIIIYNY